ncbi:thermonuclease family protein [Bradyrhizobium canariense]|uniref:thermonuclease family protein n=1 Tax=Bradyrhizobium canariense TaxID=255045 RepID=UPI000A19A0B4|nr:thermonuclease family protein [Bradyrhizobium canariense]OSI22305.1 nuclease [Bradyrhizobium canariense]OSI26896.1 nuclease [Bradyrhizobium canariense]OSI39353.1 nuclease [Bradyrhizobium canariense]OSI45784.1 nuclease [Bradyrhizobium canariense]OSI55464.1 nuclease [Bradyrhizobium canariense]
MPGLIVVLTMFAVCSIVLAGQLTGRAKVINTDTLEINRTRVRLWGIDAPDKSQMCRDINGNPYRCGLRAVRDLEGFIAEREVSCLSVLQDESGRTMATCSADGMDVGEWLVRNGLAFDQTQSSTGPYQAAQRAADHAGLGLWSGSFAVPSLYRACIRLGGRPASCSDDANAHP